jgi:hypothetical protein
MHFLWTVLAFAAQAQQFTETEVETFRACTKIVADLFQNSFDVVEEMLGKKPALDEKKLQNKIFADMLDYCSKNAPFGMVQSVQYRMGKQSWRDFEQFLKVDLEKYGKEEDLEIGEEHKNLRREVLKTEGGMKYVGDPKNKDAATKKIKDELRKKGVDPEKAFNPNPRFNRAKLEELKSKSKPKVDM